VKYVISLNSDPVNGPYTENVTVTAGETLALRLTQMTAGPLTTVSLSFGDGSANQSFSLTGGSFVIVNKTYPATGTFSIKATASTGLPGNVTTTVNSVTVFVFTLGKIHFYYISAFILK
jgi:hypothetical protein